MEGQELLYLDIVSLRKGLGSRLKRQTAPRVQNPYPSIFGPFSWDYCPSTLEALAKKSPRKLCLLTLGSA